MFLLGVVVVSGLYITLFFEFGHEASYRSVLAMEDHAIQRVVRALHRYASAVLVVTTIVHGWRIFAAGRFTGRLRRWRWATGIAALVLVWLAGVTGYWLIWDARAQALNEIVIGLFGSTDVGVDLAIDQLGVIGGRSGSGFLLLLWFVHLGLTGAIGWFAWRHLRRTSQPWLPSPHWMALMGVPLLLVSLAVPVGMLPPADPGALVGEIPVDPFVLFLLPPLLSAAAWPTVAAAVALGVGAAVLPRLLRRRDPAVIAIVDEDCTGCELCVADCPYDALRMADRGPEVTGHRDRLVAVVDEDRCVGCGVCLGSCAFGAIDLPGVEAPAPLEVDGRPLVIACDRHLDQLEGDVGDAVIHTVSCAGALAPDAVGSFTARGASDVALIGCAPSDCRFGIGNTLAAERLAGERRPHPPARYARLVTQDWVAGDRVSGAIAEPGRHPSADASRPPARRESLVGVGLIALATATGAAFATRAPFGGPSDEVAIRLVADHRAGQVLAADPDGPPVGAIDEVEIRLGPAAVSTESSTAATTLATVEAPGDTGTWSAVVDLEPGSIPEPDPGAETVLQVRVRTVDGAETVIERPATAPPGRRLLVDLTDQPPPPGAEDGRRIFTSRAGGCQVCHSVERGDDGVGPSLFGVASVAASRVDGLDAAGYLRQSILLPDQYIVDGWPAGQMLPIYRDRFSPAELDAVIEYLLTLEDPDLDGSVEPEGADG